MMADFSESPLFGKTYGDWFDADSLSIENSWDIVSSIARMILAFSESNPKEYAAIDTSLFSVVGDERMILGKSMPSIEGNTVINTRKGPVYLGEGISLRNFNSIEGPCYIGDNSTLDYAAIRGPFICGSVCKLSGEIEESYLMDYVNKHHYGFIGHSVIGSWVNLGAGTTNSDLKNNYSSVRVFDGDEFEDTMRIKMGCIIGEHTKTAIGTMINTGTVIGSFANVFEDIRDTKYVKPFSWGGHEKVYEFDKLVENIEKVMNRRGKEPTKEFLSRLRTAYSDFSL